MRMFLLLVAAAQALRSKKSIKSSDSLFTQLLRTFWVMFYYLFLWPIFFNALLLELFMFLK